MNLRALTLFAAVLFGSEAAADVVISEFLARNQSGLRDEDGRTSDWLEIVNTGNEPVELEGWSLTDNPDRLQKWRCPAASLAPGARRVVFASGEDRRESDGEWHANFQLAASGEYLALVLPDGETVASIYEPSPQFDDISYGLDAENGEPGYLNSTTPGESNGRLLHPGPVILEVNIPPGPLLSGEDLVVTARVSPRTAEISEVSLLFRVDYRAESREVMRDDGEGGDSQAGDGVYTAIIPGRSLFGPRVPPGHMLRWAVSAVDAGGKTALLPVYLDREGVDQSPQYFGAVARSPDIDAALPLFEWFTENAPASRTRTGTRASVYFLGRFYDNIYVRQRGGATNGQSQKFNFNNAFPVYVTGDIPAARELNLNAQGSDPTYLRQPLAFESYGWAGNATCESFLTLMRVNGEADRTAILIEQVDEVFLERHGFDPEGDLYKLVQRANLDPVFADTVTGIEKKTGDAADLTTLAELVNGLNQRDEALTTYLYDALNLPQIMNYLAVRSITQDADDVRKNFYVYKDTRGNGEWSIFPWDKDWTFGVTGDGGQFLKHPFFGDQAHRKDNALQWNKLYEAIFAVRPTRDMYLRRLRTCMDAMLQPAGTPVAQLRFENRVDELFEGAQGSHVPASAATALKAFFPERRRDLYETYSSLIPAAQDAQPQIHIGEIEFQPESGNQDEEYIQLLNPHPAAVDISGWTLEGAVEFTFAPGAVIPSSSLFSPGFNELYLTPDARAFRQRQNSPRGGERLLVHGGYRGHLSNRGETLILRDADGDIIDQKSYLGTPTAVQIHLLLTEIMYHPPDPDPDAEFLELFNASDTLTLDLSGLHFTSGIDYSFAAGTHLGPGQFLLLVLNRDAFEALYGTGIPVAGEFAGGTRLNNGGETLKLEDASNNTVFEISYDDQEPWPAAADGQGSSLSLRRAEVGTNPEDPASWIASSANGSPGRGPDAPGNDFTDADSDGWVRLLEDWFGTSDLDPREGSGAYGIAFKENRISLWCRTGSAVRGLLAAIESSADLVEWETCEEKFDRTSERIEGRTQERWTLKEGINLGERRHLRIRVTRTPGGD
ncbi:MAG TPA: lamin tail domain-containing protein [Verrucomicrobiales bacterium]|nr:lamin tail domain-containing protein [Verrucomicrobiales bacterium]